MGDGACLGGFAGVGNMLRCLKEQENGFMRLLQKLISAISFNEVDRKTISLGDGQGRMTFRLRRNEARGSQYVILEYGAEATLALDRDQLDEMIEAASQIRRQMS